MEGTEPILTSATPRRETSNESLRVEIRCPLWILLPKHLSYHIRWKNLDFPAKLPILRWVPYYNNGPRPD